MPSDNDDGDDRKAAIIGLLRNKCGCTRESRIGRKDQSRKL